MRLQIRRATVWLALAMLVLGALPALAQNSQSGDFPRAEWFIGYSAMNPDVTGRGDVIPHGVGTSLTFNTGKVLGWMVDYGVQFQNRPDVTLHNFIVGPKFTLHRGKAEPFFHGGIGFDHLSASIPVLGKTTSNGFSAMVGGGLDIKPWRELGFRLFEIDYLRNNHKNLWSDDAIRMRAGIVFSFGGPSTPPIPPSATCTTTAPQEVLAGEPVTVSATAANFKKNAQPTWAWTSTGGKITGNGASATIDTTGAAPGDYSAAARATAGKESADCKTGFTVKEPPKHPPTISCSANPTTVESGTASTITCTGASPDNRPLTYSWQTSGGNVQGTEANGQLQTNGFTGPATITTTVTDDRGLTASATTMVTVNAPPPPPPPAPEPGSAAAIKQELHEKGRALLPVHFDTAKWNIRPDSEQLLTNAAQVLSEEADMAVFVDGHTDSRGSDAYNLNLSKHRAAAVKTWLVKHGIAANRLKDRGFGESKPVADNNTEEGMALNRRVELVVMTDAEKAANAKAPARKPAAKKKAAAAPKK